MFGAGSLPFISESFLYNLKNYGIVLIISILSATPLFVTIRQRLDANKKIKSFMDIAETPVLAGLLIIVTAYLADGSFNPFLYFRF